MKLKNYTFVSDYAVVIITDTTENKANKTLKETVVFPDSFRLEGWEVI